MKTRWVAITGTDTGVGKTVLACWLLRAWRAVGCAVAGFKPLASGGRADAHRLHQAADRLLPLDAVNPWHFRPAVTPMLAARQAGRPIRLAEVLSRLRAGARRLEAAVLEGAGGLLSPLGEDFATRELIRSLDALPVVVAPNRLGVLNQALLTFEALPPTPRRRALWVLVDPPARTSLTRTNTVLLAERLGPNNIFRWPWLANPFDPGSPQGRRAAHKLLAAVMNRL